MLRAIQTKATIILLEEFIGIILFARGIAKLFIDVFFPDQRFFWETALMAGIELLASFVILYGDIQRNLSIRIMGMTMSTTIFIAMLFMASVYNSKTPDFILIAAMYSVLIVYSLVCLMRGLINAEINRQFAKTQKRLEGILHGRHE